MSDVAVLTVLHLFQSVLRYDKFDSISLHLPDQSTQNMLTLNELLNNFVKNELISGITCEGCNKSRAPNTDPVQAPAIKLSRFGKVQTVSLRELSQ